MYRDHIIATRFLRMMNRKVKHARPLRPLTHKIHFIPSHSSHTKTLCVDRAIPALSIHHRVNFLLVLAENRHVDWPLSDKHLVGDFHHPHLSVL